MSLCLVKEPNFLTYLADLLRLSSPSLRKSKVAHCYVLPMQRDPTLSSSFWSLFFLALSSFILLSLLFLEASHHPPPPSLLHPSTSVIPRLRNPAELHEQS